MKILKALFLSISIILINSCATKSFIKSETGEKVTGRFNLVQTKLPISYDVTLDRVSKKSKRLLKVFIKQNNPIKEEWEEKYKKIGIFHTRCKGWKNFDNYCEFDTIKFWSYHFALFGFFYDLAIPFMPYSNKILETSEDLKEVITKKESSTKEPISVPELEKITLKINGITRSVAFLNGSAEFDFNSFNLNPKKLPNNLSIIIEFKNNSLDISDKYKSMIENWNDKKKAERLALKVEKDRKMNKKLFNSCLNGNAISCDNLKDKDFDPKDLVTRLSIPGGKLYGAFKKGVLYSSQSLEVIQKVKGGYLFTANRNYFRGGQYGPAFLKTGNNINPDTSICAWFFYTGQYKYTGLNGFKQQVPAFRIYNGISPKYHCPNRLLEK